MVVSALKRRPRTQRLLHKTQNLPIPETHPLARPCIATQIQDRSGEHIVIIIYGQPATSVWQTRAGLACIITKYEPRG